MNFSQPNCFCLQSLCPACSCQRPPLFPPTSCLPPSSRASLLHLPVSTKSFLHTQ